MLVAAAIIIGIGREMEGRETEKKEAGSAWNCGYGVVVCVRAAVVVPGDY